MFNFTLKYLHESHYTLPHRYKNILRGSGGKNEKCHQDSWQDVI